MFYNHVTQLAILLFTYFNFHILRGKSIKQKSVNDMSEKFRWFLGFVSSRIPSYCNLSQTQQTKVTDLTLGIKHMTILGSRDAVCQRVYNTVSLTALQTSAIPSMLWQIDIKLCERYTRHQSVSLCFERNCELSFSKILNSRFKRAFKLSLPRTKRSRVWYPAG